MIMDDCKQIFIIGHGRSGTTLLIKALSAHPDIDFINNEFNDFPFFYLHQKLYDKYKYEKYQRMTDDFCMHPWIYAKNICNSAKDFRGFFDGIMDYYRKITKKNIIGVKIANNLKQNVAMIKNEFPDAYIVHIVRDPRDVYLSIKKTNFGTRSALYAGKSWNEAIRDVLRLKDMKNYHEIRYEDLIVDSKKELKNLSDFLKIKYSTKMLDYNKYIDDKIPYYKKDHLLLKKGFVQNNFNKWKKELNKKQLRLIYHYTYQLMKKYEYEEEIFRCRNISFIRRIFEYLYDKIIIRYRMIKLKKMGLNHKRYFKKIKKRLK
jgi:hypothetical protein